MKKSFRGKLWIHTLDILFQITLILKIHERVEMQDWVIGDWSGTEKHIQVVCLHMTVFL